MQREHRKFIARAVTDWVGRTAAIARERSGATFVVFALAIPALFGMAALGFDATLWYMTKRNLQSVADNAAMTGILELKEGSTSSEVKVAVQAHAVHSGFENGVDGTVDVYNPPVTGPNVGDDQFVEVVVTREAPSIFSMFAVEGTMTVQARAVGTLMSGGNYCVLALAPNQKHSLDINGTATLEVNSCSLAANSTDINALRAKGDSVVADSIQAVGGVEWDPAAVTLTYPPPRDGAPTVADPYADVEVIPNPLPSCLHSDYSTTNPDTLSPGRYCDDLKINSGDVVTFNPGVYLITEGDFDVNAGAVLNGTDVTIIMTADDPGDTGSFRINGSATVNLTSPGPAGHNYWPYSGDYAGILVYVDRNSAPNVNHFFNGGSNMLMQGAIYAPVDVINFGGGADITTGCLQVIGSQVHFSGTSNVTATRDDCGDLGARTLGSDLARIVE